MEFRSAVQQSDRPLCKPSAKRCICLCAGPFDPNGTLSYTMRRCRDNLPPAPLISFSQWMWNQRAGVRLDVNVHFVRTELLAHDALDGVRDGV